MYFLKHLKSIIMLDPLSKLYDRDLLNLKKELEAYQSESDIWLIKGEIKNSAGNIALHLAGNLNHFIGNQLGNTGYIRNRPLEFSDKDVPREVLLNKIEATRVMLQEVLPKITDEVLKQNHTSEFQGGANSNEYFLIHLLAHLNWHLGQVNYHRRMIN
jgi:hypothetical protein